MLASGENSSIFEIIGHKWINFLFLKKLQSLRFISHYLLIQISKYYPTKSIFYTIINRNILHFSTTSLRDLAVLRSYQCVSSFFINHPW